MNSKCIDSLDRFFQNCNRSSLIVIEKRRK